MEINKANIGHLRRLLAWMECEYCLNPSGQRGLVVGLSKAVELGLCTNDSAGQVLCEAANNSLHCPKYVRDAVRSLQRAIKGYESKDGIIEIE